MWKAGGPMWLRCWFDTGERERRQGKVYLTALQRSLESSEEPWFALIYLSTPHLPPHWLMVAQWEAWPLGKLKSEFQISAVGLFGVLFPSARDILMITPWSAKERAFNIFSQIFIYRSGTNSSLGQTSFTLGKSSKQIFNLSLILVEVII